jgi:cyclopropane-fatty-acyl-phospholipid synthase
MFEHMANWRELLLSARTWLEPQGRLFIHVFAHRNRPYRFDADDKNNWIAQHFFSGGVMPSHGLIRSFGDLFTIEREWRWDGRHYEKTAMHWLANFDANREPIDRLLASVYGMDAALWRTRWRLFLFATAGLFGAQGGEEWGVSHFLLRST